jgi:hypothetical protein
MATSKRADIANYTQFNRRKRVSLLATSALCSWAPEFEPMD